MKKNIKSILSVVSFTISFIAFITFIQLAIWAPNESLSNKFVMEAFFGFFLSAGSFAVVMAVHDL